MEITIQTSYSPFTRDGVRELVRVQFGIDAEDYRFLIRALENACENSKDYLEIERFVQLRHGLTVKSCLVE